MQEVHNMMEIHRVKLLKMIARASKLAEYFHTKANNPRERDMYYSVIRTLLLEVNYHD